MEDLGETYHSLTLYAPNWKRWSRQACFSIGFMQKNLHIYDNNFNWHTSDKYKDGSAVLVWVLFYYLLVHVMLMFSPDTKQKQTKN